MDFPTPQLQTPPITQIGPLSPASILFEILSSGGTTGGGPGVWPVANKAFFFPFWLSAPVTIKEAFWFTNQGGLSINVDAGVYDRYGNKIVSTGSIAHSGGTATLQVADIADTALNKGMYYAAMAADSVSGAAGPFFRDVVTPIQVLRVLGVQEMAAAFPLPATAVFANPGNSCTPNFGFFFENS